MDYLPQEPFMLASSINMLLRDGEYDSLEDICSSFDRNEDELKTILKGIGFVYDEELRQVRPTDMEDS